MKRTISRFVRRISRQEEIDKLKLELEITNKQLAEEEQRGLRLLDENHELKQAIHQMAEDLRAAKDKCGALNEALKESEADVKRINNEWADARASLKAAVEMVFVVASNIDDDTESRALKPVIDRYRRERGLDKGEEALDNMNTIMKIMTPGMGS